ncbi:uncharacterized protein J3R85_017876 [Psidium guajava]|nr:uncharacterized protein J3R85_017876 [Psidium guajava]
MTITTTNPIETLTPPPDPSLPTPVLHIGDPDPNSQLSLPPKKPASSHEPSDQEDLDDEELIAEIRSDFVEIGARAGGGRWLGGRRMGGRLSVQGRLVTLLQSVVP